MMSVGFWISLGVAVPPVVVGTLACWLRGKRLRERERGLEKSEQRLEKATESLAEKEATLVKQSQLIRRRWRDVQRLRKELGQRDLGLSQLQCMLAQMFDGAVTQPVSSEGEQVRLQAVVCTAGTARHRLKRRSDAAPLRATITGPKGHLDILAEFPSRLQFAADGCLHLVLRHRPSDYVRIKRLDLGDVAPTGADSDIGSERPLARVHFESLLRDGRCGSWDIFLLMRGQLIDRCPIQLDPSPEVVLSALELVSAQVGIVRKNQSAPQELEKGQRLVVGEPCALYPFVRIRPSWRTGYRVQVTLENGRGTPLATRQREADRTSGLLEWIEEIPVERLELDPGTYYVRWNVAAGPNAKTRELAALEFTIVPAPQIRDWLDAEGELKTGYDQHLTDVGQQAEQILAGLT